ncbi:MAG TPA: hypothetical protein VM925_12025 [Labilithrix sp.]|nr:hypothetical protein [Labilithrix sp.]
MRGPFLLFASAVALVGGCADYDAYGENEIVFGISQRVDAATGKPVVAAGYEYLRLANKGGWSSLAFYDGDGDGVCYFELYDHRLGPLIVDSGVATWTGGKLPAPGLQVLANQPQPSRHEGAGWAAGDMLTFDVSGFAMPRLETVRMLAPRTELAAIAMTPAPAEGAADVSLKATDDIGVTWTPTSREDATRVMVTIETEEGDQSLGGVRCFDSSESGSAVIPKKWVARLFSSVDATKPIKGHIAVSSHQQTTYYERDGWTAYIVAVSQHRAQAFTGVR